METSAKIFQEMTSSSLYPIKKKIILPSLDLHLPSMKSTALSLIEEYIATLPKKAS